MFCKKVLSGLSLEEARASMLPRDFNRAMSELSSRGVCDRGPDGWEFLCDDEEFREFAADFINESLPRIERKAFKYEQQVILVEKWPDDLFPRGAQISAVEFKFMNEFHDFEPGVVIRVVEGIKGYPQGLYSFSIHGGWEKCSI